MDNLYKYLRDNNLLSNRKIKIYNELIMYLDTIHFIVAENLVDGDYTDFVNCYKEMFNKITELVEMECE